MSYKVENVEGTERKEISVEIKGSFVDVKNLFFQFSSPDTILWMSKTFF